MPWTAGAGAVTLVVRLTPRGGRDAIEGIADLSDGRRVLAARVRAAPEDDAANMALRTLLAKAAGVPVRDVTLEQGNRARIKTLRIAGDPDRLAEALAASAGRPRGQDGGR